MKSLALCSTLLLFFSLSGCYFLQETPEEEIPHREKVIKQVVTTEETVFTFSKESYGELIDSTIVGRLENGDTLQIPLSSVSRIYTYKDDPIANAVIFVLLIAGLVAVGAQFGHAMSH